MRRLLAGVLVAVLLWGCPASSTSSRKSSFPNSSADAYAPSGMFTVGLRDNEEFSWGHQASENGDWRKTAALHETYLRRYPGSKHEEEARFELGRAYIKMGDYHRALGHFQTYLRKFPDGKYHQPIVAMLLTLRAELARKLTERRAAYDYLSGRLAEVERRVAAGNASPSHYLELGDLCYELQRYTDAREAYRHVLSLDPQYWQSHNPSERIYFDARGQLQVRPPTLTDEELMHGKVRVVNYHSNVVTDANDIEGDRDSLRVTGLARNVGDMPLTSIELEVTLLDLFGNIMNTTTVRIGNLRPGQERPFAVNFGGFDASNVNVFNVERVKFKAWYDQAGVQR